MAAHITKENISSENPISMELVSMFIQQFSSKDSKHLENETAISFLFVLANELYVPKHKSEIEEIIYSPPDSMSLGALIRNLIYKTSTYMCGHINFLTFNQIC